MTDTTQADVRLRLSDPENYNTSEDGLSLYTFDVDTYHLDISEVLDALTAYQSLGSPEYLAALVEEHEAFDSFTWDEDKEASDTALYRWEKALKAAHDNAERLREEGL